MFWNLFTLLRSRRAPRQKGVTKARAARTSRRAKPFRPAFESLEDRSLMTIGIALNPVSGLTGLVNPLFVTNAADNSDRLFVVEQRGRILVRQPNGTVSVFLDISQGASNPAHRRVQSGGEQGLLGLAFHPDFETNGLFYVHHTRSGLTNTNDLVEYRVGVTGGNVADPNSEHLLLRIPQPFSNHNGGSIEFGPHDGLLYIGKGDGGSANDPGNRAQNINELLGKILRIDVNRDDFPTDPNRNYGIPPDNPYVGVAGLDEIYALGVRNPYRFSFDRGTGLLFLGDVGQGAREEIDIVTLGGNYGWRPFEGNIGAPGIVQSERDAILPFAIFPLLDLNRNLAASITGGYVYRGTQGTLPVGSYLFGDFIRGNIFLFHDGVRTTLLNIGANTVSSFGEDEVGELYVANYNTGVISRVVSTNTNLPPALSPIANQTLPSSQDTVTVTLAATDPNSNPLTFSATAQSLALVLDRQLGLRTDNGNLYENWGNRNERWLLGRNNEWYFILPNGEFYLWDQSSQATGTLIATPGATYHARIDLLYNAELAFDLDLGRQLRTDGGNLYENWGNRGERWLLDRNNNWHFILPNGEFYFWDQSSQATGTLVATLGTNYHDLIHLLYEGDQGQALASFQIVGTNLTVNRDDGFIASVVVTATASDGELTDSKTFTVTVTADTPVAQTGFNDAAGINSDPIPGSPYGLGSINGMGGAEPGWAGPWTGGLTLAQVQNATVFEGDQALEIRPTSAPRRAVVEPMTGVFVIEQYVRFDAGARLVAYTEVQATDEAIANQGPVWIALPDGTFNVVDGVEDGCITCATEVAGFWSPGVWYQVRVVIDMTARTWEFYLNGVRYNAPDPLGFRGTPPYLDQVRYLSEGSGSVYLDALRISRS